MSESTSQPEASSSTRSDARTQTESKHERLLDLVQSRNLEGLKDALSKRRRTRKPKECNEALISAARHNVKEAMELLLEYGASPSAHDDWSRIPLTFVMRYCDGDVNLIKLLIGYCKNQSEVKRMINNKDRQSCTVLHYAVHYKRIEAVKELIKLGADANQPSKFEKETPLTVAVQCGNTELVKILLQAKCAIDKGDFLSRTALMFAAHHGHVECIKILLESGADINKGDNLKQTPLMFAAQAGHSSVMELLLEKGANINAVDSRGFTPLFFAISCKGKQSASLFLLDQGANVNVVNNIGQNPLLMATAADHVELVKKLLEKGCDINYCTRNGNHVIGEAAMRGSHKVLEYILNSNLLRASLSYLDTPCATAVKEPPVMPILDLNALCAGPKYNKRTPLTAAVFRGDLKCVQLLLQNGVQINREDGDGCTPLTLVISYCPFQYNSSLTKELLRFGADPNKKGRGFVSTHIIRDEEMFRSPLEIAIQDGQSGFTHMLWIAGSFIGPCSSWCPENIPWSLNRVPGITYLHTSEKKDISKFLQDKQTNPRTLAEWSRFKIRRCLYTDVERKIDSLPLPEVMKDYLNLPELDALETEYLQKAHKLEEGSEGAHSYDEEEFDSWSDSGNTSSFNNSDVCQPLDSSDNGSHTDDSDVEESFQNLMYNFMPGM